MNKILFLILAFILVACTPQVTVTSQVTVTLPAPTETPIPTPTVNPQFQSLQDQIAQSQNYTLTQNGDIEFQTKEGVIIIPDIKASKENGEIIFTENEEKVKLKLESVDPVNDLLTFLDKDENKIVISEDDVLRLYTEDQLSQMTDEEKLALAPKNKNGYLPDHTFKTGVIVYKDKEGKVQELYDLTSAEWMTPKDAKYVTIEEWRNDILRGPYIGDDGKTYPDLGVIFEEWRSSMILTNPEEVANLPIGTPMIILNPTGEVTVWANPDEAAERAKRGATILVADGAMPDGLAKLALKALNKEYLLGNTNLYMQFNESAPSGFPMGIFLDIEGDYIITETMPDGRIIAPVVRMPKHYRLYKVLNGKWKDYPPLVGLENSEYWIDLIIKSGYQGILMSQDDYSEFYK